MQEQVLLTTTSPAAETARPELRTPGRVHPVTVKLTGSMCSSFSSPTPTVNAAQSARRWVLGAYVVTFRCYPDSGSGLSTGVVCLQLFVAVTIYPHVGSVICFLCQPFAQCVCGHPVHVCACVSTRLGKAVRECLKSRRCMQHSVACHGFKDSVSLLGP